MAHKKTRVQTAKCRPDRLAALLSLPLRGVAGGRLVPARTPPLAFSLADLELCTCLAKGCLVSAQAKAVRAEKRGTTLDVGLVPIRDDRRHSRPTGSGLAYSRPLVLRPSAVNAQLVPRLRAWRSSYLFLDIIKLLHLQQLI